MGLLGKLLTREYTQLEPVCCSSSSLDAIAGDRAVILKFQVKSMKSKAIHWAETLEYCSLLALGNLYTNLALSNLQTCCQYEEK